MKQIKDRDILRNILNKQEVIRNISRKNGVIFKALGDVPFNFKIDIDNLRKELKEDFFTLEAQALIDEIVIQYSIEESMNNLLKYKNYYLSQCDKSENKIQEIVNLNS